MSANDEARKFADLYGRFEYALKRTGHLKKGRPNAQADWASFAGSLGAAFFEEVRSSGVANILINDPPRKQMSEGLKWTRSEPAKLNSVEELFLQGVCRVRNSYAHGEKFKGNPAQSERDAKLVSDALTVLNLAKSHNEEVASLIRE